MFYYHPGKAVPGGCVVALLGFFPTMTGVLLGWAVWKAYQVTPDDRPDEWLSGILELTIWALVCLLIGAAMFYFGMKLAMKSDMSDSYSDTKPKMRF